MLPDPGPTPTPAPPSIPARAARPPAPETYEVEPLAPADDLPRMCPGCGHAMPGGSVLCTYCGYDHRVGLSAPPPDSTGRARLPCRNCGYELAGLKTPRCPECGTINRPKNRRALDREAASQIARIEYLKPLAVAAVCLALSFFFHFRVSGLSAAIGDLLITAAQIPAALLAFRLCGLFILGFDAPLRLEAARLLGALAAFNLFWAPPTWTAGRGVVGGVTIDWIFPVVLYTGLLWDFFDLDIDDASLVAGITLFFAIPAAIGMSLIV